MLQWGREHVLAEMVLRKAITADLTIASMGPRACARGNDFQANGFLYLGWLQWGREHVLAEIKEAGAEFAATISLQWGREHVLAEIEPAEPATPTDKKLQWGREHVLAEITPSMAMVLDFAIASMGPRACARGNAKLGMRCVSIRAASMGPRACARGNGPVSTARIGRREWLQWGREHVLAEITNARCCCCQEIRFNGAASMCSRKSVRPLDARHARQRLQWGREHVLAEMARRRRADLLFSSGFNGAASMCSRKYARILKAMCAPTSLQWGREHVLAEMTSQSGLMNGCMALQWGREHVLAEIPCPCLPGLAGRSGLQWGREHVLAEI